MVPPLILLVRAFRHWLLLDLVLISLTLPATISDSPPSSVPLGTYLPPAANSNHVVLTSPDGMFNLNVETWPDSSAGSYCMAGIRSVKIDSGSMLWAPYNLQPLTATSCWLHLSKDGDLLFQYDGNQTAWQTHTAGMGVQSMSLQDSGNLVLQSKQNATLWQSFDQSPVLGFYSGMNFTANTTMYSASAVPGGKADFNVPGSYGLELNNHSNLILFTTIDDSMSRFVYWSYSLGANTDQAVAYVTVEINGLTFHDKHSTTLGSISPTVVPPSNSTLRMALIDPPSGNLQAFYWSGSHWGLFYNSSISVCEYPTRCGNFSVCHMGTGNCTCPPGFLQSTWSSDCELPEALPTYASNCKTVVDSSLYSIVSVNVSFQPQLSPLLAQSSEDCGSLCVKNCSCKAALYDPATNSCSLFSLLKTVPTRGNSSQVMLLKVLSKGNSSREKVVIGVVCAAIGAFCLSCLMVILWFKRGRRREDHESPNEEIFLQALPRLPPRFTYKELQMATKEFSTKLGSGGFGGVYEGVLLSGEKLAVKKLEEGHGQSSAQFRAEVATIGSVSHMNLVTLKGFCIEGESRLLVYEHMANGSLDRWLFGVHSGRDGAVALDWEKRCRIALDTAKGLAYLHHESAERIVHCDVKPENILLDAELNAKVADFGLAKLVGRDQQSFAMTTLKGTRGYLAPEWLQDATITAKSDVYSYGVVLLELISGKRCLDADYGYLPTLAFRIAASSSIAPGNASSFTSLNVEAPAAIQGGSSTTRHRRQLEYDPYSSMAALLDDRLDEAVARGSLARMVLIALWCVQPHPTSRPPMSLVVQMLEGVVPIPPPPLQSPSSNDQSSFLDAYEQLKSTSTTFPTFHHLEAPSQTATVESVPTTPSSWLLAPAAR